MLARDVYLANGPVRYAVYGFRNDLNLKEIVRMRRVMGNVYPSWVTLTAEGSLKSNFQETEAFTGQASPRYLRCCKVRILDSESMSQLEID
jgi:hypothetical protein